MIQFAENWSYTRQRSRFVSWKSFIGQRLSNQLFNLTENVLGIYDQISWSDKQIIRKQRINTARSHPTKKN